MTDRLRLPPKAPSDVMCRAWLRDCYRNATSSPDRSTQNHAMIVGVEIGQGWNEFVCGVDPADPANHERPRKYAVTEHAERNAIYRCASGGYSTYGRIMVCPWAACPDCARAIIQGWIGCLVTHKDRYDRTPGRWKPSVDLGLKMLRDAGVELVMVEGPVQAGVAILFDGQEIAV